MVTLGKGIHMERRAFLLASLAAGATSIVPSFADAAQAGNANEAAVRIVTECCRLKVRSSGTAPLLRRRHRVSRD
jgi:hypothetical protein